MRFVQIENGVVVNVVMADAATAQVLGLLQSDTAGIGDLFDGQQFTCAVNNGVAPTQQQLDEQRYQRRAAAKDSLIAWMAADNMARVRAGVWTVADLTTLLSDLAPVNAMMQTLSFELAAQAISASTHPLMTPAVKQAWVDKLTEHFYNA